MCYVRNGGVTHSTRKRTVVRCFNTCRTVVRLYRCIVRITVVQDCRTYVLVHMWKTRFFTLRLAFPVQLSDPVSMLWKRTLFFLSFGMSHPVLVFVSRTRMLHKSVGKLAKSLPLTRLTLSVTLFVAYIVQ